METCAFESIQREKEGLVTSRHGLTVVMDSAKTKPFKLLAGLQ